MNILGLNARYARPVEATPDGLHHHLSDGSAALLIKDRLAFAGIEERHTRKRYDGGFGDILLAFWKTEGARDLDKIDVIAVSSCCGPKWKDGPHVQDEILFSLPAGLRANGGASVPRVVIVDHHESHASLGFFLSGAGRALVAVIDGFGNLLDDSDWNPHEWWRGRFQRHSYYLAERLAGGFRLSRIAADATGRNEIGLGEAYRALTHFCGWTSYQHAGSAMALAAFGDPNQFRNLPFIRFDSGQIRCGMANDHRRPGDVVAAILKRHGHNVPALLGRAATPEDHDHCAVVRAFQDQMTEAISGRLLELAAGQKVDVIVVAGGVALNCLAMGELQRRFSGMVFVPPAPSDTGQGLGNAIWAASCISSPCFVPRGNRLDLPEAPFWGVPCNGVGLAVKRVARHDGVNVIEHHRKPDQFSLAARILANGGLVAVCMGRSEYGPRALGRRSLLADPRDSDAPRRVNLFKNRESHRPFAPAILQEDVTEYFEWKVESPFMSFAAKALPRSAAIIPAVIHADGTARIQTVNKSSQSPLRPIIEHFRTLTGIPVLLNTSFNQKGEPMIETPAEAAEAFVRSKIDALLLDGVTIQRSKQI